MPLAIQLDDFAVFESFFPARNQEIYQLLSELDGSSDRFDGFWLWGETASGKSHLTMALNQLCNAIQKQGVLSGDRVLLCTDGMLSPEIGKSVSDSKKRFSKALRNLSQKVEAILWLHPRLKRGMRHLLPQLAEGTSVRLLPLD